MLGRLKDSLRAQTAAARVEQFRAQRKNAAVFRETEGGRWQLGVSKFSLKVDDFQTQLEENSLKRSFGAVEREKKH